MAHEEPESVTLDFSKHGRFALAFAHLAVHNDNRPEVHALAAADDTHDYVQDILDEVANEWNTFLNFPFLYDLAKGSTPLNGFRHYMIQDASHFQWFYRIRMKALAKSGSFQELQDFAKILPGGLAAVQSERDDCTTQLGVAKSIANNEPESSELKEFIEFVARVAKEGDYLDSIIALLPGVLGHSIVTKQLVRDPATVRNTVYHTLLIEPWSKIPAKKHRTYINSHIASLSEEERKERWQGWIDNFKTGCRYEIDFSTLASPGNFPAYDIVPNGFYRIRNYRLDNPYLVSNPASSVTTTQQVRPTEEGAIWKLVNSPGGYSIQNADQFYLETAVREPLQIDYGVSISPEYYQWSLNPIKVPGPLIVYQLLVPGKLQYVLDAGNDPTNPKVYVTNNAWISSQLWVLEFVAEK